MAQTAADLLVRIDASTEQLRRSMNRAERSVSGFSRNSQRQLNQFDRRVDRVSANVARSLRGMRAAFGAVGVGLSVRALQNFGQSATRAADEIATLSQAAGVGAERLQSLRFAAEQSGLSAGEMDGALRRLNRRLGLFASERAGAAANAIQRLGLETAVTSGALADTGEAFDLVVRRLGQIESQSERAATASQLFGEEVGPRLARLLNEGAGGIAALEQKARDLGLVLDGQTIDRVQAMQGQLDTFNQTVSSAVQRGFLDAYTASLGDLSDAASDPALRDGLEATGTLIGTVAAGARDGAQDLLRLVGALGSLDAEGIATLGRPDLFDFGATRELVERQGRESETLESMVNERERLSRRLERINEQLADTSLELPPDSLSALGDEAATLRQRINELSVEIGGMTERSTQAAQASEILDAAMSTLAVGATRTGSAADDAADGVQNFNDVNRAAMASVDAGRDALADLRAEYEALMDVLDPIRVDFREFAEDQQLLNDALRAGQIDADEYRQALALLNREFVEGGNATDDASDGFRDLSRQARRTTRDLNDFERIGAAAVQGSGRDIQEELAA